jgi:hypothetical protein
MQHPAGTPRAPWKKAGSGYSAQNIGFKGIAGDSLNMGTPHF